VASDQDFIVVLTTWPADQDPAVLTRPLVEERLAACVNVLPAMVSSYRWEGKLEQAEERQVIIKTSRARLDALRIRLHALHPYEVPEFLVLAVTEGSDAYLQWIADSVST
jgi:periplasmic divalent cation tolerance protein